MGFESQHQPLKTFILTLFSLDTSSIFYRKCCYYIKFKERVNIVKPNETFLVSASQSVITVAHRRGTVSANFLNSSLPTIFAYSNLFIFFTDV